MHHFEEGVSFWVFCARPTDFAQLPAYVVLAGITYYRQDYDSAYQRAYYWAEEVA